MEKLTEAEIYGYAFDTYGNHIVDIYGNNMIIKELITMNDDFTYMKSTQTYALGEIKNKNVIHDDNVKEFLERNKDFAKYIIIGRSVPEEYKLTCFTESHQVIYEKYEYKNIKYENYLQVDPCLLEILSYEDNFTYYLDMAKNSGFESI